MAQLPRLKAMTVKHIRSLTLKFMISPSIPTQITRIQAQSHLALSSQQKEIRAKPLRPNIPNFPRLK